jgi:hypothetical protein
MSQPTYVAHGRRAFFRNASLLAAGSFTTAALSAHAAASSPAASSPRPKETLPGNRPSMVEADGRLRFDYDEERLILSRGLQPWLVRTRSGALVVQAHITGKAVPTARMHFPAPLRTVVSRDRGVTWTDFPAPAGTNGINLEGGSVQLRDGTILALDTYVTPAAAPNAGLGELYRSTDDWTTLQGPEEVTFEIPGVDFFASKDDVGKRHDAQRLHRRILELPNGDLLVTMYGWMAGDKTPTTYMPAMKRSRVMLLRSSDRGRHWRFVSTVAADANAGTEGLNEPALVRISQGPHRGRLICQMRTGRELRETVSDDEGVTWTPARPRVFAGLDVYRTELWVDMFRRLPGADGKLLDENNPDELRGAAVNPDLIELRSGLLVAAFGLRIPQKACWPHGYHPWNGNYLAVSMDHGATWPNVVRMTSGIETTPYLAIAETPTDNEIFVAYDFGSWGRPVRYSYGRHVKVSVNAT